MSVPVVKSAVQAQLSPQVLRLGRKGVSWRFLRDFRKRLAVQETEVERRALLAVARNTSLPPATRHRAQLGLNAYNGGEGFTGRVKNRCTETGRGRGVMSKFGLCRFQFRTKALAGEIPGMHKASW
ncbi:hypothetical protein M231_01433 [Tremella mesenterica]|uniref:30S ribosomal protein S14 n=1 Tax=Tremella mesenterica TaxID=5217 RepID=A0A4Q1BT91_TREME|nr:uncharacterized protein TREMEDRAFT_34583 [Tremella mesenterica DSM 1558]EIW66802.1 hypothetical protein TREMEDRAFT_34583 [Tremella mesenterica DSM 1558]RXK41283.1 hypothetical protein M231_01433 [Tremella mesenterica]